MISSIENKVSGVFIPVSDVERAREWYRDVLGLPVGEVLFGHLCCIPMGNGLDLLLDQKLTPDEANPEVPRGEYPLFMLPSSDIQESLADFEERGVELVEYGGSVIQNDHWFNFRDCEGNLLMVCGPPRG